MSPKARTFVFTVVILGTIAIVAVLYRNAHRAMSAEKPVTSLLTSVSDIKPGSHKFMIDLYGKSPHPADSRRLLFVRKGDGTLKAWYFPIRGRQPAAPDDDWFKPGPTCEPFEIDDVREDIKCVVTDASSKQVFNLRWTWDGKSAVPPGFFAAGFNANLKPVPGVEEKGNFVFELSQTFLAKEAK